jgi:dihydrofolate reductase
MRRLVYSVAASLDGFFAGPKGEYDWIARDSGIDFASIYSRFDTLLMGRRTYEMAKKQPAMLAGSGMKIVVVSSTLGAAQNSGVTVVSSEIPEAVTTLKAEPGKDIWLFGEACSSAACSTRGLVDEVSISVFPVMLGAGVPLLPEGARVHLKLNESKRWPAEC